VARRRINDEVFIVYFSSFMTNVPGVSSRHLWIYCCFCGISRNNVEIFQMPRWMTSDNVRRY